MRTIKFRGKDVNTGEWLYWQFGDGNGENIHVLANIDAIEDLLNTKE